MQPPSPSMLFISMSHSCSCHQEAESISPALANGLGWAFTIECGGVTFWDVAAEALRAMELPHSLREPSHHVKKSSLSGWRKRPPRKKDPVQKGATWGKLRHPGPQSASHVSEAIMVSSESAELPLEQRQATQAEPHPNSWPRWPPQITVLGQYILRWFVPQQ